MAIYAVVCEDLPAGTRTFCQTCVTLQHILRWFLDCFFSCPPHISFWLKS